MMHFRKQVINLPMKLRICILAMALSFASCATLQKQLDIYGINSDVSFINSHFSAGSPAELETFLDTASLEKESRPLFLSGIRSEPCSRVPEPLSHDNRIHEKLVFPSVLTHRDGPDSAVFYVCKRFPSLEGRKVIVWVPGMGIADYAFRFIVRFFREELARDYDIVLYVPPYHMERAEQENGNGRGFFTANTLKNIRVMFACVQELRTMCGYLHELNVKSIGAWSGSMGASMILLCGQTEPLDHLCMMIPVLDWRKSLLDNPSMKSVKNRIVSAGFDTARLSAAYALISPSRLTLPLSPGRTQIFFGNYDQLNDSAIALDYARKNNIVNIIGYPRSHSTQLFDGKMIRDYGRFLDGL
jgi:hypothetical protein